MISDVALKRIPTDIIEEQRFVDKVTGATLTSTGFGRP